MQQGAPHILIVDDHREIRDLVSRALSKEGFRISVAADGRAMRKVLDDGRIDLILLDLCCRVRTVSRCAGACAPSRASRSSC
jgi:DNA-binding response OmpR family regulator